MGALIIVGLGSGSWDSLTLEAAGVLGEAHEVYVRTLVHPSFVDIARHLPDTIVRSFDDLYQSLPTLPEIYERIAEAVIALAHRAEGVVYAVPGSPSIGETTVRLLQERATAEEIPLRLVQGLSFAEPMLAAVGVADVGWIEVIDASEAAQFGSENALGEVPGEIELQPWRAPVPTQPMLISPLFDRSIATGAKLWLGRFYPDDHEVLLLRASGTEPAGAERVPLYEIDRAPDIDYRTSLYVPPLLDLDNVRTFAGLMNVTRRLRAPGGCPWDREQNHASLKPYLLEEAYEVIDALDAGDAELLSEELGDLLYQITIHSQVAAEAGDFTIEDVFANIACKMIGRHPHVFGEMHLDTAQDVRHAWEGFKQRQKPQRASIMEGIPGGLPALPQSNLMQKRAASVGFEWPTVGEVLDKVEEEVSELRAEIERASEKAVLREELGDLLFALVSVARHLRIDPEEALRLANRKFAGRFGYVEQQVASAGKSLRDLSPAELDAFWNEAKSTGA